MPRIGRRRDLILDLRRSRKPVIAMSMSWILYTLSKIWFYNAINESTQMPRKLGGQQQTTLVSCHRCRATSPVALYNRWYSRLSNSCNEIHTEIWRRSDFIRELILECSQCEWVVPSDASAFCDISTIVGQGAISTKATFPARACIGGILWISNSDSTAALC